MSRFDATPRTLNAFVDGELDLATQLDAEAQLEHDAALRQGVEQLRELSRTVRAQADYHAAPQALRERLVRSGTAAAPTSVPQPARRPAWGQRWGRAATGAGVGAFGMLLLAASLHVALAPRADDLLLNEAVASHARATLAQHSIDVASSDQHTVKPWLSARLDFSPPVQHPLAAGAVLEGGRLDYLGGRPVAVLAYRLRAHQIDVYVWPSRDRSVGGVAAASRRGFQLAAAERDGMSFLAVSDVNADDLARVLRAVAAGDAPPG